VTLSVYRVDVAVYRNGELDRTPLYVIDKYKETFSKVLELIFFYFYNTDSTSDEVKYISFWTIFVPLLGIDAFRDARGVDGGTGGGYGGGGGKLSSGNFSARNVENFVVALEFISISLEIS